MQSKLFSPNKILNLKGRLTYFSQPKIMGILNVTPDSFYEGSRFLNAEAQLRQVEKMLTEGADIIDVGGYSTRSGAGTLSQEEEMSRVIPVIQPIAKEFPEAVISIDTFRAAVARKAVEAGASLINDISGGEQDEKMGETAAELNVPYIFMHMRGTPQTMQQLTQYENLVIEVIQYFQAKITKLHQLGVKDIVVDPGFGFAKTPAQSFEMLNKLDRFHILNKPLLVGLSRKSMIWKTLQGTPEQALNGTTCLNTIALLKGASLLRVHDVREAKETIQLVNQLA
ncbi:MAG: dihydropteroate synthase [Bacteroidetes bacterium]|nr:dihydropteroate synthase [Bacteroidota bacterium]